MAVRPPSDDADSSKVIEFGIAALEPHLEDAEVHYPVSKSELATSLGDRKIPVDAAGRTVSLGRILDDVESDRFDSEQELMNELHPAFEAHRLHESSGVIGKLRSFLPF